MPSREKQLGWLLATPTLVFLLSLAAIPIAWPLLSKYEGVLLPVVTNVEVEVLEQLETGLVINVEFDKPRACEFIGLSWYDAFGDRLGILFDTSPGLENVPSTRPAVEDQIAGPWRLMGIDRLLGSQAIVAHQCHPLWITYSVFYVSAPEIVDN